MIGQPVITTAVLRGMPELVRAQLGERALLRAERAAGFSPEALGDRDCYVPHRAVVAFVRELSLIAGEPGFGLMLAPHLSVSDYGPWGQYVLGADTLAAGLARCMQAFRYHSAGDRMWIGSDGNLVRFGYSFAGAGCAGYDQVAASAAALLVSLCARYAPPGWRPVHVELDIPRPRLTDGFEAAFGCPVGFGALSVGIVFDRRALSRPMPARPAGPVVTIEDVARARWGRAPADPLGVIAEQVHLQVLAGRVSLDSAARALNVSVRSLQRELTRAGTDFRSLAAIARNRRARELLRHSGISITEVSHRLGYSAPSHFSRAFQRQTGLTPGQFRSRTVAPAMRA